MLQFFKIYLLYTVRSVRNGRVEGTFIQNGAYLIISPRGRRVGGWGVNSKRPASLELRAQSCIKDISFSSDERKYSSGWRRNKT